MSDARQELCELLKERSIKHGNFTLASGATSTYYCDTKATALSPRGSRLMGEVLCDLLAPLDVQAVGGLAMGSVYLTTAVTVASDASGKPIYGFTIRKQEKDHGLKQRADESFHPDGKPLLGPGRRVAVVDDVLTTGGSIQQAIEKVRGLGCEIVAVVALVDRKAGGEAMIREQGLPFYSVYQIETDGVLKITGTATGSAV